MSRIGLFLLASVDMQLVQCLRLRSPLAYSQIHDSYNSIYLLLYYTWGGKEARLLSSGNPGDYQGVISHVPDMQGSAYSITRCGGFVSFPKQTYTHVDRLCLSASTTACLPQKSTLFCLHVRHGIPMTMVSAIGSKAFTLHCLRISPLLG
jgi:hypothetical protein